MSNWTLEEQKEHRKELIKALRSGEYKQSKRSLRNASGYCCLGVACDVAGVEWEQVYANLFSVKGTEETCNLPLSVKQYYGFRNVSGGYKPASSLMYDNDFGNKSFSEIADIIESEPEGLFE